MSLHRTAIGTCILSLGLVAVAGEAPPVPVALVPVAHVQIADLKESSGIVASRRHPGVFWSHNDSGDAARLFAFRRDGSAVRASGDTAYTGIGIDTANNRDWEDITTDDAGQLYVGDTGNNGNARDDLAIYVVPEPDPATATRATVARRIAYAYPDQTAFPPPEG